MFQRSRLARHRVRLRPPDHAEQRDGRHLLVWGDVPHWMVVDGELRAFLEALDGTEPLGALIRSRPAWASARRALETSVGELLSRGAAEDADEPRRAEEPDDDALLPIENVAVNVTRRCNLRCRFCYNLESLTASAEGELTAPEIIAFVETTRPFLAEKPSLTFLGGEPLLCPDKLLELADYGRRRGFETLVSTNGTRVTEAFAAGAKRVGLQVQVSLDGHTAEHNDAVRGQGAYARAVAGVRTLVRGGAYTILSMVCHRGNLPHLGAFYDLARSLGVHEARFIPLKLMGGAPATELEPVPMRELMLEAFGLFTRRPELLALTGRDAFSIMANTCRYSSRRQSCGTGLQTLLLDADGTLYPCLNTNVGELRVANVRDAGFDFARVWRGSPVLRRVREASFVGNAQRPCSRCLVRYWCLGGCRGETLATTGDLSGPAWNCADLRRTVVEMLWLLAERPDLVKPATHVC